MMAAKPVMKKSELLALARVLAIGFLGAEIGRISFQRAP